ncbi:MAG: JAB domain-containing protein, partial [Methylocella sp.]
MVDHSIQVTDPGLPSVFTVRETKIIGKAMNLIEGKVLRERPILNRDESVERYLMLRFAGLTHEQFHVLYLDNSWRLIASRTEFFGTPSFVGTDVRRIVLHALTLGAVHVAFAHNHPGGDATPSKDDIQHMNAYENILSQLDIHLLDSFIVTSRGIISTKAVCKRRADEESRKLEFERDCRRAARRSKIALPAGGDEPKISPVMAQYCEIKAQNQGSLLFYRMGDFYELFFEDAEIAAKALGIVLTKRGKHEGRD